MINEVFSQVIFVQFFASILVLCTSLYHLSSHVTIIDIITLIIYVLCMFVQIFVYCWAGNEVILKVVVRIHKKAKNSIDAQIVFYEHFTKNVQLMISLF